MGTDLRPLFELRDNATDENVKRGLRFAIGRIESLEERLREVLTLCKSIQRVAKEDS